MGKGEPRKRSKKSFAMRREWQKKRARLEYSGEHSYCIAPMEHCSEASNTTSSVTEHDNMVEPIFDYKDITVTEDTLESGSVIEEPVFDWIPHESELDCLNNSEECDLATASPEPIIEPQKTPVLHEFSFISQEEYKGVMEHELCIETGKPEQNPLLLGHRIVDLKYVLKWSMWLQSNHEKVCTGGVLEIVDEDRRGMGLVSSIKFKCRACGYTVEKRTEDPNLNKSKINYGSVWGTLSTGSTYHQFNELMGVMDVPCMPYRKFQAIEKDLGDAWKKNLWDEMEMAGREELQIAKDTNKIVDGFYWTTVFVDGGWSRRSYGHNYNAASGVAVIIGRATGKLLFLGVRNKYCSVCARAANKKEPPNNHVCFKNWHGSSGAMEADIIVEGFKQSLTAHGLKYLKFISDGDSSVFAKIRQEVPYGDEVTKTECRNHAVKNLGKYLYKIKADTAISTDGRKLLTAQKIKSIQNISMRMLYIHAQGSPDALKNDLDNVINHCFGEHSACSISYCDEVGDNRSSLLSKLQSTGMLQHLNVAMERFIKKGHALIDNETNNRAELFMSIACKFNAGKRLNLTQRGSFETRCHASALRYNQGPSWMTQQWRNIVGETPGKHFKKFIEQHEKTVESGARRRLTYGHEARKARPEHTTSLKDYGPKSEQPTLSKIEFESEKNRLLKKLKVTKEDIIEIEEQTIGQWGNRKFELEHKYRLTASRFGDVVKRRPTTNCKNLVKHIICPATLTSEGVLYGKEKEAVARQKFKESKPDILVRECGLFVDEENSYLAATPDGVVGQHCILEIKCLHSVHKSGKTLKEAAQEIPNLCVEVVEDTVRLKRKHNYYFQIQGQLNITKKKACFFVIYINDQQPLHIELIKRDEELWTNIMLPKLKNFYFNCLLPKFLDKNMPCFDPIHSGTN